MKYENTSITPSKGVQKLLNDYKRYIASKHQGMVVPAPRPDQIGRHPTLLNIADKPLVGVPRPAIDAEAQRRLEANQRMAPLKKLRKGPARPMPNEPRTFSSEGDRDVRFK